MTKKITLIFLLLINLNISAQTTYVPDDNFEQALIDLGYDNVLDDYVTTSNIDTLTALDVSNKSISDLTGIENFIALETLYCYDNLLTNIDISNNINLVNLFCNGNQLTSLDISQLGALSQLRCHNNLLTTLDVSNNTLLNRLFCSQNQLTNIDISMHPNFLLLNCSDNLISNLDVTQNTNLNQLILNNNQLTGLDLSQNPNISTLYCNGNQLTNLDLTANVSLTTVRCQDNQLTSLNIKNGNNTNINSFNATDNPNLTCIEVDDDIWSTNNWTLIDSQTSFSENCSLSINNNSITKFISIYPNPTKNTFKIDTKLSVDKIQIFNYLGIPVKEFNKQENYNISNLANGVYFIKIISGNRFETQKVILK